MNCTWIVPFVTFPQICRKIVLSRTPTIPSVCLPSVTKLKNDSLKMSSIHWSNQDLIFSPHYSIHHLVLSNKMVGLMMIFILEHLHILVDKSITRQHPTFLSPFHWKIINYVQWWTVITHKSNRCCEPRLDLMFWEKKVTGKRWVGELDV